MAMREGLPRAWVAPPGKLRSSPVRKTLLAGQAERGMHGGDTDGAEGGKPDRPEPVRLQAVPRG